jgi:hypothetical protein
MKLYTRPIAYCVVSFFAAVVFTCSTGDIAGNSSQTTNGNVLGMLMQSDGETPAGGVSVTLRPRNTLPIPDTAADTDSNSYTTVSNSSGHFDFDTLAIDTGLYIIEATKAELGACLIDSVLVSRNTITEVKDTLRAPGAIQGTIYLSEGGNPDEVYIMAFGINRFAVADSSGHFCFAPLSKGTYDLRIVTSLKTYGIVNIRQVRVTTADTTDLDTIGLPFTATPIPKNPSFALDVPAQSVILRWNRLDTTAVKGYRIYRSTSDSDYVKLNAVLVTDTFFIDSSTTPFSRYTYRIAAVDTAAKESALSAALSVNTDSFLAFKREPFIDFQTTTLQDYRFYDLDNDKDQDLVATINDLVNGPTIRWYENNNGQFIQHTVAENIPGFMHAYLPTCAQINSDGTIDILAVLDGNQKGAWLVWFKNNGSQRFSSQIPIDSLTGFCAGIWVAGMRNSTSQDIVLTIAATNGCVWYEYINDSTFTRHIIPTRSGGGTNTLIADFDRDGDNDFFMQYYYDEKAYWYEKKNDSVFVEHQIDNAIPMANGAVAVDFHGNKLIDIVSLSSTKGLYLYRNDGFGAFTEKLLVDDAIWNFIPADLSADKSIDIAVTRIVNGQVGVAWYQNTTDGFKLHPISKDVAERLVDVVDVNGDGLVEIVTRDELNNAFFMYTVRTP